MVLRVPWRTKSTSAISISAHIIILYEGIPKYMCKKGVKTLLPLPHTKHKIWPIRRFKVQSTQHNRGQNSFARKIKRFVDPVVYIYDPAYLQAPSDSRPLPSPIHPIHPSTRFSPNSNDIYDMNRDEIVPAAVQEAPSSSSATYTSEQLKEFLERNWNTIHDQRRYLVENTETAVHCAYCKEVVELGEDPSQREVNWAVHVKLDHKRRPFIDDPHCELIFGTDSRVSCSACETDIALTRSWLHQKWEKHITTVTHLRNVGEITTPTSSDARRQRFADDPAVIVLSDFDIHCLTHWRGPVGRGISKATLIRREPVPAVEPARSG
ncbi:hypothetical protein DFP72DRAFT_857906 [Ephemerocybe angulata]|uniref:Uncharacterized protein n=1 Tax=Ephemerocybe angulata TaxID=980116 RepID=A0A8H6HCS7_9AGAR|nr:hypothetical protein DFP72DRAFT_857906 [Tulosesus angulatus]